MDTVKKEVRVRGKNGGARAGAGRPKTGRKKIALYVTDAEQVSIRELIVKLREVTQDDK